MENENEEENEPKDIISQIEGVRKLQIERSEEKLKDLKQEFEMNKQKIQKNKEKMNRLENNMEQAEKAYEIKS